MDDGNISCSFEYRAWTWQEGCDPLGLTLQKVGMAELGSSEAMVRNAFIGLNPVDWRVLGSGDLGWEAGHVSGDDGAGTVIAVGEDAPEAWLGSGLVRS